MPRSNIDGGRYEAISVALFGDIPDARKGEVIADERELILCRHIEDPLSRLRGGSGVRIKAKYPFGMAKGNRGVCDRVTRIEEVLARRRDEVRRVPRGVTATRYD